MATGGAWRKACILVPALHAGGEGAAYNLMLLGSRGLPSGCDETS